MNDISEFLDLYRQLEEALKAAYPAKAERHSTLVYDFMHGDGKKYFDDLDLCRELRNVLTHHSSLCGTDAVHPSDELLDFLRRVIEEVKNPVTARQMGTPLERLLTAVPEDRILWLAEKMASLGFSHVPIVKSGILVGVFSVSAAFSVLAKDPALPEKNAKIADILDLLAPKNHVFEKYLFACSDTPLSKIKKDFRSLGPGKRRVAAVFVTKDGTQDSKLLSMITPWDVIRATEEQ